MPTPTKGQRLGSGPAHQRLMLANLATSLFEHGKITTTEAKAKRLRPLAERLITFAKRGDLHARRQVLSVVRDKDVVAHLFTNIGPSYTARPGGYTRITKVGPRKGDNAPMAVIELVEARTESQQAVAEAERARGTRFARRNAPSGATAEAAADLAAESPTAAAVAEEAAEAKATTEEAAEAKATTEEAAEAKATTEPEEVEESASDDEHPYGPGSHAALDDGSQPEGFPIKGNEDSKLYHVPDSSHYDRTVAEVWFASAEDAEAAGFRLPPSQREQSESES